MSDGDYFRRGFYTTLGVVAAFLFIDVVLAAITLGLLALAGVHFSDLTNS